MMPSQPPPHCRPLTRTIATLALLWAALPSGCSPEAAPADAPTEPPAAAAPDEAPPADAPPADAPLATVTAPEGASVRFVAPADGAVVKGPAVDGKVEVAVQMGAEGIAVKAAGPVEAGSGHHHILVDVEGVAAGQVVPKSDQHLHFGQGQTEAKLALAPGPHTLRLQFADGIHRSYGPALGTQIAITVEAEGAAPTPPVEK